ncbi:MAG: host nuclease inhibitor protein [Azoarcus sp.]|jgi:hypothetical protein|nr:host nuclease inhibitor protein [Azoarcus sp.]
MYAYAWRSGQIEFGAYVPRGALKIAAARNNKLIETIEVAARHGKGASHGQLLVPGIPEAGDNADKAKAALIAFRDQVNKRLKGEKPW